MKAKFCILISVLLITGFIFSKPICAEDIIVSRKVSEKSYKISELKTDFLKTETKKIPVMAIRTESGGMSKGSATWLGVGIGLVVGGATGLLIGSTLPSSSDSEQQGWNELGGAVIGGLAGMLIGGVTGHILGK